MTPAELRTAHDALGLTADFLAEQTGLHVNMIWRYERPSYKGNVPDHVAEVVQGLAVDLERTAERVAAEALAAVILPRYTEEADFHSAYPELEGWPMREAQGILLTLVLGLIRAERGNGTAPEIIYR